MDLIPQAIEIGRAIETARLANGYESRQQLVDTRKLRNKITQEGLRKIEKGERVPRLENLQMLCDALGISGKKTKELAKLAVEANVKRLARRAGNATITFQLEGKPIKVFALPPKRKMESFVREVVTDLVSVVDKYGVLPQDIEHFTRHARSILLRKLTA